MSLLSRRDFLNKLSAFAIVATQEYDKPEAVAWRIADLNAVDPYAKSFEDMTYYNHGANCLPSVDSPGQYWHIFTEAHGIEDDAYWGPVIEDMVRDERNYLGKY